MLDSGMFYRARLSAQIYVDQLINEGRLPESRRQKEIDAIVEQKLSIVDFKQTTNRKFVPGRYLSSERA